MSRLAEELVGSARGHGAQLTGNVGLLTALTQKVCSRPWRLRLPTIWVMAGTSAPIVRATSGRARRRVGAVHVRNGSYPKTLRTEVGEVTVQVPAESGGEFRAGDRAEAPKALVGLR